jgi:hypothetical protein
LAGCLQFHVNKYCIPWTVARAMSVHSRISARPAKHRAK